MILHSLEVDVEDPQGADQGGDDDDEDKDDDLQQADLLQFLLFFPLTIKTWTWVTVHLSFTQLNSKRPDIALFNRKPQDLLHHIAMDKDQLL